MNGYYRDETVFIVMLGYDDQDNELGPPFHVFWSVQDAEKFRDRIKAHNGTATVRPATMVNARFVAS